jgi:signal transduction histidine kinase
MHQVVSNILGNALKFALNVDPVRIRTGAGRASGSPHPSPCHAPERLHIAAMATAHRLHRRRLCLSYESKLRIHVQDDC